MFWNRKKDARKQEATAEVRSTQTKASSMNELSGESRLGSGLFIKGEIHSDENVVIAGRVEGEINVKKQLIVTESGKIDAQIRCGSIIVRGEVNGNVEAREEITIETTGKLTGDITTKTFSHRPGGFFEGYSHMVKQDSQPKDDKKTSAKSSPKKEGQRV